MSVFRRGRVFFYQFMVRGERYRGSTKQKAIGKARAFESALMAEIIESGSDHRFEKAPLLSEFSTRFFAHIDKSVESGQRAPNTRKGYKYGWKRLEKTKVAQMRIDQIGGSDADELVFAGSPSSANNALRTLSCMLSYACELKIMRGRPKIKLREEHGREKLIEPWLEELLLEFAPPFLAAAIIIEMDCGMRPEEIMRMRWEHVFWDRGVYFNAGGKSKRARRHVIMPDRMRATLRNIQGDQRATVTSEWVFPSDGSKSSRKSASGHRVNINKAWGETRKRVEIAMAERGIEGDLDGIVFYSARHTHATEFLANDGELSKLCMLMGHSSIVVTQKYLHPTTVGAAEVMNKHNQNKARLRIVKSA